MAVRYSQEVADRICAGLADGMTLRQVCRQDGMPSEAAVRQWQDAHEDFASQYARAREKGYLRMAEELLEIADDGSNDWMEREGVRVVDHEHVARSRLRLDTRKWLLSKALPKIYGDKLQTQQLGKDGQPVDPAQIQPVINLTVAPPPKSEE